MRPKSAVFALFAAISLFAFAANSVRADLADVYLRDGTVLRGEVEKTDTEIIVRNQIGVVRVALDRVERIEPVEPLSVDELYQRRLAELRDDDVDGHFALAEWAFQQQRDDLARESCEHVLDLEPDHAAAAELLREIKLRTNEPLASQPTTQPAASQPTTDEATGEEAGGTVETIAAPERLDRHDILKLKLSELDLDGEPERVRARILRLPGEPSVEERVIEQIARMDDPDLMWERTLRHGRPYEKLQVILTVTGLKFADRIDITGDTAVFTEFRRQVIPLIVKSCARSGCHSGPSTTAAPRFPDGPRSTEGYVYTTFEILERMETNAGKLIDRELPESSLLVQYMLPADEAQSPHPPVDRGRVIPALTGKQDRKYDEILDWIASLKLPRPDYRLSFNPPDWLEPGTTSQPAGVSADGGPAPHSQPADRPNNDQTP